MPYNQPGRCEIPSYDCEVVLAVRDTTTSAKYPLIDLRHPWELFSSEYAGLGHKHGRPKENSFLINRIKGDQGSGGVLQLRAINEAKEL